MSKILVSYYTIQRFTSFVCWKRRLELSLPSSVVAPFAAINIEDTDRGWRTAVPPWMKVGLWVYSCVCQVLPSQGAN